MMRRIRMMSLSYISSKMTRVNHFSVLADCILWRRIHAVDEALLPGQLVVHPNLVPQHLPHPPPSHGPPTQMVTNTSFLSLYEGKVSLNLALCPALFLTAASLNSLSIL